MSHALDKELTDQRILFCHKYIELKFNGRHAAIEAGYSEEAADSIACRLLSIAKVKNYICKLIKEKLYAIDEMTLEWVQDINNIQRADIKDFFEWDNNGLRLKASDKLKDNESYAISQIEESTTKDGIRTIKLKLEPKIKALELKGKFLSLFGDNDNQEKEQPEMTAEERKERIAFLLKKREEK